MRRINAAYRVLSDARQRAAYDARRYLQPTATTLTAVRPRTRPVVMAPPPAEPSPLQRRADRVVALLGILLIVAIGMYSAFLIPRAEPVARQAGPTTATAPVQGNSTNLPQRLLADPGLRSFPGTVLVPPNTLAPFKDLPIMRLDATSQGIARYAVYYGDLTTGLAGVSGLTGRASFDSALPHISGCSPDAPYCTGLGVGQSASDAPGVELFQPAHLVGDDPAFVVHRVCCNGVYWSLSWYDPAANMSYTIDLSRNVALQFGSARADDNADAARAVGALASQLVRLP
jgi:hypothetical protein